LVAAMFSRKPKEPVVTLFYVTDLHGSQIAYRKFLNAAQAYGVSALICGGDVAGKQMYPIIAGSDGVKSVEMDGRSHRLDTSEALTEAKAAIGSRGGYDVELSREEAEELANDEAAREALFTRLVKDRLSEWIALAEERLAGSGVKVYVTGGNDDSVEMLEPLVASGSETVVASEDVVVEVCGYPMVSLGWSNITPWNTPRETDEETLAQMLAKVTDRLDDYERAIFNLHVPPKDSSLDTCAILDTTKWPPEPVFVGGEPQTFGAGSVAVDSIIREREPLLGLHGHIHESAGVKKIGRTTCVNPGSDYTDGTLRGAVIALRGDNVKGVQRTTG
jgi:Icc-related predicted phosphoesterase